MKLIFKIAILFVIINFSILAKSRNKVRLNISIPQTSSSNGASYPFILVPGINPYFFNSPAYGNLLLNQYEANIDAINRSIAQPQSDLGAQFLGKMIQKEITDELIVQPIQSGNSMPNYRVTNIIDHGKLENAKNPKFKNVDYLLWKFQNIEEGTAVQVNGNQLEISSFTVFTEKPDSLLSFIHKEKSIVFLLESRANGNLSGYLVDAKSKKTTKVQCTKLENKNQEIYKYEIKGDEVDFKDYISLFEK